MSPEFTWSRDPRRGGWVIRRHGTHYLDIPPDLPFYTEAWVQRFVKQLNGEKTS